jgi:hypothetical protein
MDQYQERQLVGARYSAVLITLEGLLVQPTSEKLKVGIRPFDHPSGTSTMSSLTMPKGFLYIVRRYGFSKDSKGRIVLVAKDHTRIHDSSFQWSMTEAAHEKTTN